MNEAVCDARAEEREQDQIQDEEDFADDQDAVKGVGLLREQGGHGTRGHCAFEP